MIRQSIARRYARGLFAVGEKDGKYKDYLKELDSMLSLFEGEQRLKKALMLPLLEMEKRKELLGDVVKIAGISLPLSNILRMLLENNRMDYFPLMRDMYGDLVDDKEGRVKGTVWSAYPLPDELRHRVQQALGERLHKEVVLTSIEDKTLIGGIKVEIKGTIIDGSVRRQLETLKQTILKE